MDSSYKIGVVGLWHLGETYSAGLAELGHDVVGIDADTKVVEGLSKGIPPLAEPKLAELIAAHEAAGNLSYSADFSKLNDRNVVWFTVDTPVNDDDEAQTGVVLDAIKNAMPHFADGVLVVVSSQIPVGTSAEIIVLIKKERPGLSFDYAYSPENLRLGDAMKCFMEPGRVVVGAASAAALAKAKDIFSKLNAETVSMSPASAEMAKHTLNAFLATSISFTNDIADLCEQYGADVEAVAKALKSDPRVGPKAYLFAGLGFSGGTLGRDLRAMMNAGADRNVDVPVITSVFLKNKSRNAVVERRLLKELGEVKGKTFAMFGVTYKAGTSTLRRSQPLEIEKSLRDAGAVFHLYDPLAKADEVSAITPSPFSNNPYDAARGVDAVLVLTPSKDFKDLDFAKIRSITKGPLLFDTCNILCDKEEVIREAGFNYISIGR